MANYSGMPQYGGQYGAVPPQYAQYQQNAAYPAAQPIPPYNQQQPFYPPYPPPQQHGQVATPGTMQYPPYPPPQNGQIPYPPMPPPGFYNPYANYNNHAAYNNAYIPTLEVAQNAESIPVPAQKLVEELQTEQAQFTGHRLPEEISSQSSTNGQANAMMDRVESSQINKQISDAPQGVENVAEEDEVIALSSRSLSEEADQTPMQIDSATTEHSTHNLGLQENDSQDSPRDSELSFDPYSGTPAAETGLARESIREAPLPAVDKSVEIALPGLGSTVPGLDTAANMAPKPDPLQAMENQYQERKAQAVQAIQDLASRKIGYEQISTEDFDLDVLKGLYAESGVPMVLPIVVSPPPQRAAASKPAAKPVNENKNNSLTASAPGKPADPPATIAVPDFNSPISVVAKKPSPKITTAVENLPPKPTTTTTKETLATPTTATSNNRQDYLARLQAAKDKTKAVSSPTTAQPIDRAAYLAKLQAVKAAGKESLIAKAQSPVTAPSGDTKTIGSPQIALSNNNPSTQATMGQNASTSAKASTNDATSAEPTKESATSISPPTKPDLMNAQLRQKLEALRRSHSASTQAKQQSDTASMSATPVKLLSEEKRPASSGQISGVQPFAIPPRTSSVDQAKNDQVSFFSPSVRKEWDGLPGLFELPGLSGLPGLSSTPATSANNQSAFAADVVVSPTAAMDNSYTSLSAQLEQFAKGQTPNTHSAAIQEPEMISQPAPAMSQARKRPLSVDFVNAPPAKIRRASSPLQPAPMDISDEDGEEGEVEEDEYEPAPARPPFTSTSSRTQSYNSGTPAIPGDLQAKEREIEELKQKILAATLRKTGKDSTFATAEKSLPASTILEEAKDLDAQQATIKDGTAQISAQEQALAAAKIQAQKHLEQSRRDKASLNAHADRVQNEADRAGSAFERDRKLQRKAEIETLLPAIDATISSAETDLVNIKKEQELLLARLARETQARSALMDELKDLLQILDAEKDAADSAAAAQAAASPKEADEVHTHINGDAAEKVTNGSTNTVDEPIDVSSSVSDAESQAGPAQPTTTIHDAIAQLDEDDGDDQDQQMEMDLDEDSADEAEAHEDEDYDPETRQIISDGEDNEEISYEPTYHSPFPPGVSQADTIHRGLPTSYQADQLSQEIQSTPVPISSDSSVDMQESVPAGEEVVEKGVEDPIEENVEEVVEEEDVYEPSPQMPLMEAEPINASNDNLDEPSQQVANEASEIAVEVVDPDDEDDQPMEDSESGEDDDQIQAEPHILDNSYVPSANASMIAADTVEEPSTRAVSVAPIVEEAIAEQAAESPALSGQEVDAAAEDPEQHTHEVVDKPTDMEQSSSKITKQHYVPYRSPLSDFTSYRFHPEFTENITSGFRSLTYNHNINPKVEMCRWELAGETCNDPHCEYQHFKDISLNDNMLLLQLGSVHEGATQEQKEAYVAGLRDTINAMRARGLRDVDSIASEIAAYRRKFLGDSSRVIANLNIS